MGFGQHRTAKKFLNMLPLLNGLSLSRGNMDLFRNYHQSLHFSGEGTYS